MQITISNDFKLSPSIRQAINSRNHQIEKLIGNRTPVRYYLTKASQNLFEVKIFLHWNGHDFAADCKDEDFYKALTHSKENIVRKVNALKQRLIHQRKAKTPLPA
jgi:ribosomal subunit interface protein